MNWTGMDALHVDTSPSHDRPSHLPSHDRPSHRIPTTTEPLDLPRAPEDRCRPFALGRPRARLGVRGIRGVRGLATMVGLVAVLAAACGDVVPARGWPSPVETGGTGDERLVVIQSAPGKLTQLAITPAGVAERWTFPGPDDDQALRAIYATPIVRGSNIVVAGFSGDVLALDAASGRPVVGWGGKVGGQIIADPVLTSGNQMFVATDHGAIHPVDLSSGTIFPSKLEAEGRVYGQGAAVRDSVYYGTLDKHLFALDATSGAKRWEVDAGPLLSNLVALDDALVVGTLDSRVRAYNASDGAERWSFSGAEWFWAAPLVAGNVVYAVDLDGRAYALEAATGAERWSNVAERGNVRAAPVIAGGSLIFTPETTVYALDPATGTEVWASRFTGSGKLLASPLVLESGVLFVTDTGTLIRVQPASGAIETLYTPK
ncbi:MAG: PQQ-binding-like beta-propeller repeat protein [Dehalococcoidia bacterium]|nr:PQQ-binding-like beta-propeller repeat protein [Dehalococcoidia bacterium]